MRDWCNWEFDLELFCDVKQRGLTMIPAVNAPNVPVTESCGKGEKVALELWGRRYQTDNDA